MISLTKFLFSIDVVRRRDKLIIFIGNFLYLATRTFVRMIVGKEKRNKIFELHRIGSGRFFLCDVLIKYRGFICHVRKNSSDYQLLSGHHEPEVENFLLSHLNENDNFIDIGANVGKYVFLASKKIRRGRIVAVEPHPEVFKILKENVFLNSLQAECFQLAIGEKDDNIRLYENPANSGGHSIIPINGIKGKYFEVRMMKLDTLIGKLGIEKINWLLIDTEGAEDSILRNANVTLSITDNLIVEIHNEKNMEFVSTLLKNKNYKLIIDRGKIYANRSV